jgi:enamine deaminase RidA (YjgF/YER057c/UK114 family)
VDITRYAGSAPWEAEYGYCRVVRAGDWALVAGTTATGAGGVLHPDDAYGQTRAAFTIALEALAAIGIRPDRVVRTRMYDISMGHQQAVGRAHRELFGQHPPVSTMVQVGCLAHPEHLVEVEVEAYAAAPSDDARMTP